MRGWLSFRRLWFKFSPVGLPAGFFMFVRRKWLNAKYYDRFWNYAINLLRAKAFQKPPQYLL